jgi:hypothetical protein
VALGRDDSAWGEAGRFLLAWCAGRPGLGIVVDGMVGDNSVEEW